MPPTTRGMPSSFIALWVEDLTAKLWSIELDSGAADEIARFTIEGMTRPQVLELARTFAKARQGRRSVISDLDLATRPHEDEEPPPVKRGRGRPRKAVHKEHAPGKRGGTRYVPRDQQMARQAELYEALKAHGGEGIEARSLAIELGRNPQGGGVSLGLLEKAGKAIRVDGKWYAVENGDIPPPAA